ncbi:AfsR/SARP family transcriptional regulator [Goodfellowiella coeruleoviolacea]|uniref:AfsR/SARP family transcriptional regulator n=1 Tax=Goodfellowiella coeruleoviolacea TaxID=334858 RepID=UPI0020A2B1C6|nr:AfsR/SARP family transcriptional regulator [Goodfellowiella coeruleoviolacea]
MLKALWPSDAPPTARKMLQNAVAGVRRLLATDHTAGRPTALLTHAPGYLLRVEPECVDVHHFRCLAEKGRAELAAGSWELAARSLRGALALWRGPALADLVEKGVSWPALAAVQDRRLGALENCFDAELACGRHYEIVGELEALIEAEPLRERLYGQLMIALYRSGRQADALSVYQRTHAALVEGLGIEPGPQLQKLQRMILEHDPALALPLVPTADVRSPAEQRPHTVLNVGQRPPAAHPAPVAPAAPAPPRPAPAADRPGGDPAANGTTTDRLVTATARPTAEPRSPGGESKRERKPVTVLLMLARVGPGAGDDEDTEEVDVAQSVATAVRDEIQRFGAAGWGEVSSAFVKLFDEVFPAANQRRSSGSECGHA